MIFDAQPDGSVKARYCSEDAHEWELGLLGTGTEKCKHCAMGRFRQPRENPEEEKRLQYAEEGFRNAAAEIAKQLEEEAHAAMQRASAQAGQANVLLSAAQHARLIGKGRDGA